MSNGNGRSPGDWTHNHNDAEAARQLDAFLPGRIFDAHAHLYRVDDLNLPDGHLLRQGPSWVDVETWRAHIRRQVGGARLRGALFVAVPTRSCDIARLNDYLVTQLDGAQRVEEADGETDERRGFIAISPRLPAGSPKDFAAGYLSNPRVAGFKVYHVLSDEEPTFGASLGSYLPEWAWQLAHDRELIIMLHLVKERALADPDNHCEIREMCKKYPKARLILAHAARGFHSRNTVEGLPALRGLENVWLDTSAICESAVLTAILKEFGPRKLLWGSDFPVSETRGRCVSAGDGFVWLDPRSVCWEEVSPACHPILVGLESLRALREAADQFCLNEADLQDIFCDNAFRLLGIPIETSATRGNWIGAGVSTGTGAGLGAGMGTGIGTSLNARMAVGTNTGVSAEIETQGGEGMAGGRGMPDPGTARITEELYRHGKERIPGGTQLLSKRPEMLAPNQWPAYFREARGCETWDLDGRHYFDMSTNGIGTCLLGFRDPDVTRAVQRRISLGSMSTLNPPEEVELADLLCEIHPWAEQARFVRAGGEACAAAVRIARAITDRSLVAICGYHGWHDWYLAANLGDADNLRGHLLPGLDPLGVPRELRGTAVTFKYNDRDVFESVLHRFGDRLAAVVMEPCRNKPPEPGFLELVRDGTQAAGALLIYDEITIGWRLYFGGSHLKYGVNPDMAVLAKALGNGHPIGVVIGTREAMSGAHSSFVSSTYWTEGVGPVAALATLRKMRQVDVPAHVSRVGGRVMDGWRKYGAAHGLPVEVDGFPCLAHFRFDHELGEEIRTLYTQLMLERGFLAGSMIYPTMAHTDEPLSLYLATIDEVFGEIAGALEAGDVKSRLKGPVAHGGFRRLV